MGLPAGPLPGGARGEWRVAAVLLATQVVMVVLAYVIAPAGLAGAAAENAVALAAVNVPVGFAAWHWLTRWLVPSGGPSASWPEVPPTAPGWYPFPGQPEVALWWDGRRFTAAGGAAASPTVPWLRRRPLGEWRPQHRVPAVWLATLLALGVLTLALVAGDVAATPALAGDVDCGRPPDSAYRSSAWGALALFLLGAGVIAYRAASAMTPRRDGRLLRLVVAATVVTLGPPVWFWAMELSVAANCGR